MPKSLHSERTHFSTDCQGDETTSKMMDVAFSLV